MVGLIKRWGLLVVLLIFFSLFLYFHAHRYLSFESLKTHQKLLLMWMSQNWWLVFFAFMALYTVSVAISLPGAVFLTITAGFLFGPVFGTLVAVISATLGAFLVFLAVKLAFRQWVKKKTHKWLKQMEKGFHENAFSYLFFLRLIPLFPFWVVNIVPALLGMKKWVYVLATFVGIIPGSFIYVSVGNGLGQVIESQNAPNLKAIFDLKLLLPLLALALLSFLPIVYKKWSQKQKGSSL